jgi:anthranilate/para-aminobenzoate synthase component II
MNILITQQEIKLPFFPYRYDALERSWHQFFRGHRLIPAVNDVDYNFDLSLYDCLVLGPGPDSLARHHTENLLYALADAQGLPIIGFCHGAFAINDITGGINLRDQGHADTDHVIMMQGRMHTVNSYHSQVIDKLAPGFEVLATDSMGRPEAFRHMLKPQWGVVWHPERMIKPILPPGLADFLNLDLSYQTEHHCDLVK